MRETLIEYILCQYGAEPEYLWARYPDYAVFRHGGNRKWFALIAGVPREKLGLSGAERVDVLNVKLGDPLLTEVLLRQPGFYPGYHMHHENWISILLDGTVPFEQVTELLDRGFAATAPRPKRSGKERK